MKLQSRRAATADHLDVAPEHLLRVAGAERFHRRFLCRKSAGEMDRGSSTPLAVGNLFVRENAPQEPIAVAFDCRRDARDICGVEAKTNDVGHPRNDTSDAGAAF